MPLQDMAKKEQCYITVLIENNSSVCSIGSEETPLDVVRKSGSKFSRVIVVSKYLGMSRSFYERDLKEIVRRYVWKI